MKKMIVFLSKMLTSPTVILTLALTITSCGVKGDPLPPETPPPIGRGEPDFSGAMPSNQKKKLMQDEWDKEPEFQEPSK